mgnify:CR=1 FL=1
MLSHNLKRYLSLLLSLLLVFSLMPVSAWAAEEDAHDHSSGDTQSTTTSALSSGAYVPNPALAEYQAVADDILNYYLGSTSMTDEQLQAAVSEMNSDTCYEAYYEIVSLDVELEYAYNEGVLSDADMEYFLAANTLLLDFADGIHEKAMQAAPDISFFATTVTPIAGVDVTDSGSTGKNSNGTVTITATGGLLSKATNNVTITNTSGKIATLNFHYALSGNYDSHTLSAASGDYSALMNADATYSFSFTSARNRTATLTLSNFSLVEAAANSDVTIEYDSSAGSVTAAGSAVSSGATITGVSFSDGVALVATPKAGATFLGWIDQSTHERLSTDASYTYKPAGNSTVAAAFVKADAKAWFSVGTKYYDDLNAAAAAAVSGGGVVILAANGTLPSGNYTIPEGVTLLIPYDAGNTLCTTKPTIDGNTGFFSSSANQWVQPTAYRTLQMATGASITVNGAISLSGKMCINQGSNGCPSGPLGFVNMASGSNITINNGANLYAWGYITGSGAVTVKSGGTVYENFQVKDWRGGTAASAMIDKTQKVFPVSQYYVQNVEVPMALETGAKEYGYMGIVASKCYGDATVPFIGSGSMFINAGTITKDYNENTDRLEVDISGNLSMSSLVLSVDGGLATYDMNSANYVLPITNNLTVRVNSGTTTISQDMCFLPGSEVIIGEGATVKVATGVNLYVYDLVEWAQKLFVYPAKDVAPLKYVGGKKGAPVSRSLSDAKIVVNGELNSSAGYLYTTAGGANITSDGGGHVVTGTAGTATITYQATQSGTDITFVNVPVTAANLLNKDTTYQETTTEGITYTYTDGKWICDAEVNEHTYENNVCTICGYEKGCEHSYTSEVTKEATCNEAGIKTYTCSSCGASYTEEIEKLTTHTPNEDDGDCTTEITCSVCGTVTTPAETSHTGGNATCKVLAVCTKCGKSYGDLAAHTPGEAATCTTAQTCTVCGAELAAALNHDFSGAWQKDDTNHWKKCSRCDATDQTAAHSYGDWIVDTAATCTAAGSQHKVCSCGHTVTEAIAALGHNLVDVAGKEATCTEDGYTAYKDCSRCDYIEGKETIAKVGHTEVIDEAVAATCTTTGLTEGKHCSVCNAVLVAQTVVDALGHTEVIDEAVAATCTATGLTEGKHCSVCNAVLVAQTVVDALGHKEVIDEAVDPSCTETGLTGGSHCSVCGEVLVEQTVVDALGHTEVTDAAVAPTCTATGLTEGKHCSVCNEVLVAQETVNALGHTNGAAVIENNVEATCTADGSYDTVIYCTVCNEELSREKITVDALGHTEVIDAAKEATCTATGLTEGKHCSVCNAVLVAQTVVDALGHTNGAAVIENNVEATCTADGSYDTVIYCTVCNEELSREKITVDALGHTEVIDAAKEATCTATGLTEGKHCSVCGEVTVAQTVVNALGHTAGETVVENAVEATCGAEGSYDEVVYCSVCDAELSREKITVDALGHTEVVDAAKAPNCTETGLTEGKHCSVCNEVLVAQETVNALGHTNGAAVIENNVEATCTADGSYDSVVYCTVCNTELSREKITVDALGHDEVAHEAQTPTCTEIGWDAYVTCSRCDYTTYVEKAALGHDEVSHEAKAPTCTEIGWDAYVTCSRCDYTTYVEKAALGHDEVSHEAKAPTCTEIGWDAYVTCSRCDYTTYVEKAALGHDEVSHEAKAPTCTEIGWDAYVTCTRCDYSTYVEKAALDHEFAETLSYDENGHWYACTRTGCTEKKDAENHAWDHACDTDCNDGCGYTRTITHSYTVASKEVVTEANCVTAAVYKAKCAVCGDISNTEKITGTTDATNHTGETDVRGAKDATCVAEGYTGDTYCSSCNTKLQDGEVIAKLTTHTYPDNWTQTKAPTCTEEGSEYRQCTVEGCESTETRDIAMVAHTTSYTAAKDATCAETGNQEYWYCSVCKGYFKDEQGTEAYAENAWVIEKTDHIFETTYTTDGEYHWYKCTNSKCDVVNGKATHTYGDQWKHDDSNHWHECVCGDKVDLDTHDWGDGVVTTQPTTSATGVMTYTCSTCGATRTETIDKLTGTTVFLDVLTNNLETGPQITLLTGTTAGEGWNKEGNVIAGSTVDFSVTFDKACVVIVETTDTDGNLVYTKVPAVATADKNTYNFSTAVVEGMRIIVAVKGDVDGNGIVNAADAGIINRSIVTNAAHRDFEENEEILADIDSNGTVNAADAGIINRSIVTNAAHKDIEW